MDRQIVYAGAIPLETDLLNTNKNVMIALAKLSSAVLGTSTVVNGFAVTPTSPASLQVNVAPGEIYSMASIDASAYSSLAADTTHQIMKQGIVLDSQALTLTAPSTNGYSVNYLIQATYQDQDTNAVALPYYNSTNPSIPWSGPGNNGQAQYTARKGAVVLTAKAGVPAATGSQATPAPDSGNVGLYVVTVAYGQTQVVAGNISQYASAPFISMATTSQLAAYLQLSGGNLTGPVNANRGTALPSAATVNIGAATGEYLHITGSTTITAFDTAQAGTERIVVFDGALTLTHSATSLILPTAANITTAAGDAARFRSEGSGNWRCVGYTRADGSSLGGSRLQVGTAVATTSGLAILFSSIPSWAKRITISLSGVSTSGSSPTLVQLGSGSVQSTGYNAAATSVSVGTGNSTSYATSTAGFPIFRNSSGNVASGNITLVNLGSNTWIASGLVYGGTGTSQTSQTGGTVTLSGAIDRINLTSANGTDTFNAGLANIIIEG